MNTSTQEVITQAQKALKDIVYLPTIELTQEPSNTSTEYLRD